MLNKVNFAKIEEIVPLAPFLETDQITEIINQHHNLTGDIGSLIGLAPFMDSAQIGQLLDKLDLKANINQIIALAPFMDEPALDKLALRFADEQLDPSALVGLAPFMSQTGLSKIVKRLSPSGIKEHIVPGHFYRSEILAPMQRADEERDMQNPHGHMPFIDSESLTCVSHHSIAASLY